MIYAGAPARDRRRRAKELLEQVGLGHRLNHRPSEMSGGEQQRTAIARALANSPTILFADEPTGNLPTEQGHQVMQALKDLNLHGMTVLVVTHDPGIAGATACSPCATEGSSPMSRRRQAGSSRRRRLCGREMSHLDLEAPGESHSSYRQVYRPTSRPTDPDAPAA